MTSSRIACGTAETARKTAAETPRESSVSATAASVADSSRNTSTAETKTALRSALLARRKALSEAEKHTSDARICERVIAWCEEHRIASLGVFHPIRKEPDLFQAYNALIAKGVHLALPMVTQKDQPLEFRRWQPGDVLQKDALGTSVPPPAAELMKPQALLIPCVGFNQAGMRLGYGGGFYDRTLALPHKPVAVGVAYAFSRADFYSEPHDIALDLILTDEN